MGLSGGVILNFEFLIFFLVFVAFPFFSVELGGVESSLKDRH